MNYLPHIEVETSQNPDASVIWLHGLGADGHDFEPIVPELRLPKSAAVRFIFPHAPSIPVTINGGYVMPAWYDILEMSISRKVDYEQLLKSSELINQFVEREIERGISSNRIILAGFSQGGAVAIQCALTAPVQLGGLLAMSTYFATEEIIQLNDINKNIPIEIHHGTADPVVPVQLGEHCHSALTTQGYQTDFKTFPMEHSVCQPQIEIISGWLQKVLNLG
ncbi:alpha/beta hydrolase [Aliikangiella coralliicola]|uniref:Carboxylesterase n=1 Tax=Aliikangiella coralliicola TaxID=2592383 RepID=A0A545UDB3_9GAMM|nr:dienelactone hydrolase family protein [Aliikangiella coralliicola]TQV87457.1 carboxylesterase [Aliikangiella coralliicola]